MKAFYVLLRDLGYPASRHAGRLELLPRDTSLLLLLAPPAPLEEAEAAWAKQWVEGGGTLIWAPRAGVAAAPEAAAAPRRAKRPRSARPAESDPVPDTLLAAFGLKRVEDAAAAHARAQATLDPLGGDPRRVYALEVSTRLRLAADPPAPRARPLARDGAGWIAAVIEAGRGRFVALADPGCVANGGMKAADHAEFAVHLAALAAGGGRIAFDEFHHGDDRGQSAFAVVWNSPLRAALILLVLAAYGAVLASGRRLGPPAEGHEERRRRPAEFMDACASLCRRLRAAPAVAAVLADEFELDVRRRAGGAAPEAAARIAARAGLTSARLTGALERARALARRARVEEAELLACARELESIRAALRRAAARPNAIRARG
jgi:hypothetical protein